MGHRTEQGATPLLNVGDSSVARFVYWAREPVQRAKLAARARDMLARHSWVRAVRRVHMLVVVV